MKEVIAAKTSEMAPGSSKKIAAEGREIALFNAAGKYYAIAEKCPHKGGPLSEGELEGTTVTCPWHGWQIDLKTGHALTAPKQIETYKVSVRGEDIIIEIP